VAKTQDAADEWQIVAKPLMKDDIRRSRRRNDVVCGRWETERGRRDGCGVGVLRVAALICGLIAGLGALVAPMAMGVDLMTTFLALWGTAPSQQLLGTVAWYAPIAAAVLGGLLAFVAPGLGAIVLFAAGAAWIGIGVVDARFARLELLVPGFVGIAAAVLAFLAGELEVMRRRAARRARRDSLREANSPDESQDWRTEPSERRAPTMNVSALSRDAAAREREEALAREAALRMDPLTVPRDEAPPRPTHEIPLTLEDVVPTEALGRAQSSAETIWPSSSAPRRSVFDGPDEIDLQPRKSLFERPAVRVERRETAREEKRPERTRDAHLASTAPPVEYRDERDERRPRRGAVMWLVAVNVVLLAALAVGAGYYFLADRTKVPAGATAEQQPAPSAPAEVASDTSMPVAEAPPAEPERLEANVLPALAPDAVEPLPTLPMAPADSPGAPAVAGTFDNPFDYCRAVGTVDYVDARYVGPHLTAEIADALRVPLASAPDRVSWRCAGGAVMACASFDWPVCAMTPAAPEMIDYCLRNPGATRLLAPNGTWSCDGNKPKLPEGANWPVDDRGFYPAGWIPVLPSQRPTG
jgi:hypothetical protein